jgi:hypothetical protein
MESGEQEDYEQKIADILNDVYEEEIPLLIRCIFDIRQQANFNDRGDVIGFAKDIDYLHRIIKKCLDKCHFELTLVLNDIIKK